MYPNIPPGYGLGRYHFDTSGGDGHAYVLMGFENTGSLTADLAALALWSSWTASSCPINLQSTDCAILDATTVLNTGGIFTEGIHAAEVIGSISDQAVPPQVSILVQKVTGVAGRHFKGRQYWPGFPMNALQVTSDRLADLAGVQVAANAQFAAMTAAGLTPAILHRDLAVSPTLVNGFVVQLQIATQRRRNRKVAHH